MSSGVGGRVDVKRICKELEEIWRTEADFTSELRKRGVELPRQVGTALEGAKILINLCKHHPNLDQLIEGSGTLDTIEGLCIGFCGRDVVGRVECELRNLEDLLTIKAFNALGQDYAMSWQNRLNEIWERVGPHFIEVYCVTK